MQTHQLYAFAALERVQRFLDSNGVIFAALKTTPARTQLDAAVTQLSAQSLTQSTATQAATGQITRQRQLMQTLKLQHMQPIAKFARANLKGTPDIAAVKNSAHGLSGNRLVLAARAMATSAAPYAAQFTAAQFPADALAQLSTAADAVATAITNREDSKGQRVAATSGIRQELASGRQAVAMLDPVVTKLIAADAGLLAAWRVAMRITVKGVPSVAPVSPPAAGAGSTAVGSPSAVGSPTAAAGVIAPKTTVASSGSTSAPAAAQAVAA